MKNTGTGLSKVQIAVMAVAAGVCVANVYYNQPILKDIATAFHANESSVGAISVLTQVGYGLGLFFLIPLGDKVSRKKLILTLQFLLLISLVGMFFAPTLFAVKALSLCIGLLGVAAQVILPMAADLDRENKGRTVGIIFTGILIGILAARVFSGFVSEWLNWRYVYGISALFVLLVMLLTQWVLPDVKQEFTGNYGQLLVSTISQIKRFSVLRLTAVLGAMVFGAFCSFWTTLTFHLSGPPFNYKSDIIGLFGLLAIGGALLAPVFGKLADKGKPVRSQVFTTAMIITGVVLIKVFPDSLASFFAAVLLLDIGVQATQVTNVATIYSLDEAASSRINTVYMTSYFIGGSLGTFAGIQCWRAGGWQAVTWQLLIWSVVALLLALNAYRHQEKRSIKLQPAG